MIHNRFTQSTISCLSAAVPPMLPCATCRCHPHSRLQAAGRSCFVPAKPWLRWLCHAPGSMSLGSGVIISSGRQAVRQVHQTMVGQRSCTRRFMRSFPPPRRFPLPSTRRAYRRSDPSAHRCVSAFPSPVAGLPGFVILLLQPGREAGVVQADPQPVAVLEEDVLQSVNR